MMRNKSLCWLPAVLLFGAAGWSQTINLPAEVQPFLEVSLHARVAGYVERVLVDRGTRVRRGQLLIAIAAPEMQARIAEAESKGQAAEAERLSSEAQLAAVESTYDRLKKASETQGAVAGNELSQIEQQAAAARATVSSRQKASEAAQSVVRAAREMQAYLNIKAPFDGVVTDRLVHPGALVGPGPDPVLLVVQQVSRLRLVVAVPEEIIGTIERGGVVKFTVPSSKIRIYSGTIARISHALDAKTRTMPIELDVFNRDGSLAPGMYATVKWPVRARN